LFDKPLVLLLSDG